MPSEYMDWIEFSVTGSADGTYTQANPMNTGLNAYARAKYGMQPCIILHEVEAEFPRPGETAADVQMIQICTKSQAAEVHLNDPDLLCKFKRMTSSEIGVNDQIVSKHYYPPQVIPFQNIYAAILVNGNAGAIATVYGRLGITQRDVDQSLLSTKNYQN